jgi:hypothetical protein
MSVAPKVSFTPLFTKPTVSKEGVKLVTLSKEEVDNLINEFSSNEELVRLMLQYIDLARRDGARPSEVDDVSLRRKIFPYFDDVMWKKNLSLFSSDIAEEMFQRIESGVLEVRQ